MAVLGQGGRLVLKRPYHEGTYTFSEGQLDTDLSPDQWRPVVAVER